MWEAYWTIGAKGRSTLNTASRTARDKLTTPAPKGTGNQEHGFKPCNQQRPRAPKEKGTHTKGDEGRAR